MSPHATARGTLGIPALPANADARSMAASASPIANTTVRTTPVVLSFSPPNCQRQVAHRILPIPAIPAPQPEPEAAHRARKREPACVRRERRRKAECTRLVVVRTEAPLPESNHASPLLHPSLLETTRRRARKRNTPCALKRNEERACLAALRAAASAPVAHADSAPGEDAPLGESPTPDPPGHPEWPSPTERLQSAPCLPSDVEFRLPADHRRSGHPTGLPSPPPPPVPTRRLSPAPKAPPGPLPARERPLVEWDSGLQAPPPSRLAEQHDQGTMTYECKGFHVCDRINPPQQLPIAPWGRRSNYAPKLQLKLQLPVAPWGRWRGRVASAVG